VTHLEYVALWVLLHLPHALFWWGLHFLLIARSIAAHLPTP